MTATLPATARVRIALPSEHGAVTELTERVGFAGAARLALVRQPGAGVVEGTREDVILAPARDHGLAACAVRVVKSVVCRGRPTQLGYLGALRAARPGAAALLLREGFDVAASVRRDDELPFDLTVIGADNTPALRVLNSGARGLPRYLPWTDYETVLLPVPRRVARQSPPVLPSSLSAPSRTFLRQFAARHALAEHWSDERLDAPHRMQGMRGWFESGDAVAGLWDLSALKTARVLGYSPALTMIRRFRALVPGIPPLPDVGHPLRLGYLAPCAWDNPEALLHVIEMARTAATGLDWLVFADACGSPALSRLRRLHPFAPRWRSRIFLVATPDSPGEAQARELIRSGTPRLDVALL